jgi:hypothetical protein
MSVWFARRATQNINANDGSTWNDKADGTGNWLTWANLAAGDVLCANSNAALAINVNVTCSRISTAAEVGSSDTGAAGGGFTVTDARTIVAGITGGTTPVIVASGTAYTWSLTGDITAQTSANHGSVEVTAANTLTYSGTSTGGGTNNTRSGILNSSGTVNITGTVACGTAGPGVTTAAAATTTLVGNIINGVCAAVIGPLTYNPGATNYIQYPAPGSTTLKFGKTIPAASVVSGVNGDGASAPAEGTCAVPTASQTLYNVPVGATVGNVTLPNTDGSTPDASLVLDTAHFGVSNGTAGTYAGGAAGGGPLVGEGGLVT